MVKYDSVSIIYGYISTVFIFPSISILYTVPNCAALLRPENHPYNIYYIVGIYRPGKWNTTETDDILKWIWQP